MSRILIVAPRVELRVRLTACLSQVNVALVAASRRTDAVCFLAHVVQVLVYVGYQVDDLRWLTERMREHLALRVVYISAQPWASLDYARARCLLAPPYPAALNTSLVCERVSDLLGPATKL